jgi:hypothetical protein
MNKKLHGLSICGFLKNQQKHNCVVSDKCMLLVEHTTNQCDQWQEWTQKKQLPQPPD